ncbi:MAG: DUF2219 family protein [Niastella sp.]|nr:DUF2219 family protein [Niastella sp.]
MLKLLVYISALSALLLANLFETVAQDTSKMKAYQQYYSFGVFYDQDYTLEMVGLDKLNEDRNYTMGLGFFYSSNCLNRSKVFYPNNLFDKLFRRQKFFTIEDMTTQQPVYAIMIANGAFTPDSLPAIYPIKNDRPYSSLIYMQTVKTGYKLYKKYTSTFNLGLLGTSLSRELQIAIHKQMNRNDKRIKTTIKKSPHEK